MSRKVLGSSLATAAALLCRLTFASDPTTVDCLAATETALKLGNQHKLRAERSQLLVCASQTCPSDIRRDCLSRLDEVNAQIPTIVFAAKDATGADLSAVKVAMDGDVLAERLEGTSVSIDPGEHTFVFETAGQSPLSKKLVVVEGQKDRREAIVFGSGAPSKPRAESLSAPSEQTPAAMPAQKVIAIATGAAGIVGLGIGGAFGAIALSQKSTAQSVCPATQCATQEGVNDWSSAASTGNVSTVALVIGGVGVVGAAILWVTAPSTAKTQVGIGLGGFQVKGTW